MTDLHNKTLLIIGLGMIGGSVACGLRQRLPGTQILAVDQNADTLAEANEQEIIDGSGEIGAMVAQSDLVLLAVPPSTLPELLPRIAGSLQPGAVVTDVGSVKSHLLSAVRSCGEGFEQAFVPGHPIAGSEKSGFGAANGNLFVDRNVILTPLANNTCAAVALVNQLWRSLGANVLAMSAQRHDQVLAATSHLPHLLAYGIVDVLTKRSDSEDIFRYAAGGFTDFSRVASSNAKMWADVFIENNIATEAVLDDYIDELQQLKAMIHNGEHGDLMSLFARAKQTRDEFVERNKSGTAQKAGMSKTVSYEVHPGAAISGSLRVPGDKSISHRAIIFGSLAEGVTQVSGFLEGEDAMRTVAAFREMGVTIVGPEEGKLTIYGVGKHGLQPPRVALNMGNSGTAMRLMAGLLAAQQFDSQLYGDESLNNRPMSRIADPLRTMGAQIETDENGTPPLTIRGSRLSGIDYDMPVASAQVKSCLLLAGMYADGETRVTEPGICRDHTERMLRGFSYPIEGGYPQDAVSIAADNQLVATNIDIPADISSAAFFLVAASICPGSDLILEHVGINPTRIGIINLLQLMGADISLDNQREAGGEPVADIRVRSAELQGITIPAEQVPLAIDEFPVLFVAAACAQGQTLLRGAEELRVKESDRIEAMAQGLKALGVDLETFADGIRITGGAILGGEIESHGDHRIAMAFAVAALRAEGSIRINDCQNVATSFPHFPDIARAAGFTLHELPE